MDRRKFFAVIGISCLFPDVVKDWPIKQNKFGTFAGGKFFSAQGIYFTNNFNEHDTQELQLIDGNKSTRSIFCDDFEVEWYDGIMKWEYNDDR